MKRIFEELRENISANSVEFYTLELVAKDRALALVNAAEAKWESECCEWKPIDDDFLEYRSNCDRISAVNSYWKVCPYCGKPIKISEVE